MDPDLITALRNGDTRKLKCAWLSRDLDAATLHGCADAAISHAAGSRRGYRAVKLLLKLGADPNALDGSGMSAVHWAAGYGSARSLRLMLRHGGLANLPCRDTGLRPAHFALKKIRQPHLGILLKHGADPNAATAPGKADALGIRNCIPPLCYLPYTGGDPSYALELLRAGADVNGSDSRGRTPLMYAAASGTDLMQLLLQHGADARILDSDGKSALHYVAGEGIANRIKLLLEAGVSASQPDREGRTPLHQMLFQVDETGIDLLIAGGASIERDSGLLELAAAAAGIRTLGHLLRCGMHPDGCGRPGEVPLQRAALATRAEHMRVLLSAGADPGLLRRPHGGWVNTLTDQYSSPGHTFTVLRELGQRL